jgi:uncharacterized protein YjbI with pentapeptide repeats
MADEKLLEILNSGVETWNKWRRYNAKIKIDLQGAQLVRKFLPEIDLSNAILLDTNFVLAHLPLSNLSKSSFHSANLKQANFSLSNFSNSRLREANMRFADFQSANFENANLEGANLLYSRLNGANFRGANLTNTCLRGADLREVNLTGAILSGTDFSEAIIDDANFENAILELTTFAGTDLSKVTNLETCNFLNKCFIDYHTLKKSGELPLSFLRGCGLSNIFIENKRFLHNEANSDGICLISYSINDCQFAERIYSDLQNFGIRCYYNTTENLKIELFNKYVSDFENKKYDKLLLILSESSLKSNWIKAEVIIALSKEKRNKKIEVIPIILDEYFYYIEYDWAGSIKTSREVLDFTNCEKQDNFNKSLEKLLMIIRNE